MKNETKKDRVSEIIVSVTPSEYEDAKEMAKTRGFDTIEELMAAKFERIMSIYYGELDRKPIQKKKWEE